MSIEKQAYLETYVNKLGGPMIQESRHIAAFSSPLKKAQKVLLLTKQKALSERMYALMLTGLGKEVNPKFKHPFKH